MANEWFVKIGGEVRGPLTGSQVRALVAQGLLSPSDGLSSSPHGPWRRAGDVPGLFASAKPHTEHQMPGSLENGPPAEPSSPASNRQPAAVGGGAPGLTPPNGVASIPPATTMPPVQGVQHQPNLESAVHRTKTGPRVPKPAELRLQKRKELIRVVRLLAAVFCAVVVLGSALVLGASYLRAMIAAKKAAEIRRLQTRPAAEVVEVQIPQDLDSVIAEVGSALSGSVAGTVGGTGRKLPPVTDRWFNAATERATVGQVTLRIAKVKIGWPRLVSPTGKGARPRDPCLLVYLEMALPEGSAELEFSGWTTDDQPGIRPQLRDANNRPVAAMKFPGLEIEGQLKSILLRPGESVTDLLVFRPPEQLAGFYELTLPAEPLGGHGLIRFRIPSTMIEEASSQPTLAGGLRREIDTKESQKPSEKPIAHPEKPAAHPPEPSGEISSAEESSPEEESDRIPIPGLHE